MAEDAHVHEGTTGPWTYKIYASGAQADTFNGAADVSFHGKFRCKLVLSLPGKSQAEGVALLKQKCIAWILKTEAEMVPGRTPEMQGR